jgi:hypothetical protein
MLEYRVEELERRLKELENMHKNTLKSLETLENLQKLKSLETLETLEIQENKNENKNENENKIEIVVEDIEDIENIEDKDIEDEYKEDEDIEDKTKSISEIIQDSVTQDKKISAHEETIKDKKIDDPKKEEDDEEGFKEFSEKSNPILKRLINKEPTLFSTDKNKFFTEYSRLCQANIKKQPVILTQEEKDIIDEKDRQKNGIKSYTESFQYGTKEGNTYHYICPRYWDLEKNISLSHEEVLSKKYGNVITKKNKDGTYDGNIMEFTDPKHHLDETTTSHQLQL